MLNEIKKALVISPHPDDLEIGCGGTVAKLVDSGATVANLVLCSAEYTMPGISPPEIYSIRMSELNEAKQALAGDGLGYRMHVSLGINNHRSFIRSHVFDDISNFRKNIFDPDIIFIPSTNDLHQDHVVAAQEAIRIFKNKKILGYEMLWNNLTFNHQAFSILNKNQVGKKIKALSCFKSQGEKRYFDPEFVMGWARTRGVQINTDYAESFEVIRWVF